MTNQYNDSSILDQFELDTVDIGGDPCHGVIVLSYDLDADCYTVETFIGTKSQTLESFDTADQAAVFFAMKVWAAKRDDRTNRAG